MDRYQPTVLPKPNKSSDPLKASKGLSSHCSQTPTRNDKQNENYLNLDRKEQLQPTQQNSDEQQHNLTILRTRRYTRFTKGLKTQLKTKLQFKTCLTTFLNTQKQQSISTPNNTKEDGKNKVQKAINHSPIPNNGDSRKPPLLEHTQDQWMSTTLTETPPVIGVEKQGIC